MAFPTISVTPQNCRRPLPTENTPSPLVHTLPSSSPFLRSVNYTAPTHASVRGPLPFLPSLLRLLLLCAHGRGGGELSVPIRRHHALRPVVDLTRGQVRGERLGHHLDIRGTWGERKKSGHGEI